VDSGERTEPRVDVRDPFEPFRGVGSSDDPEPSHEGCDVSRDASKERSSGKVEDRLVPPHAAARSTGEDGALDVDQGFGSPERGDIFFFEDFLSPL
jgi:hypothetical protein